MSNNSTIKCPNCQHEFPIGNALAQEIEADIKARYLKRFNDDKQKLEAEKLQLAKESEALKVQSENQERVLADRLRMARLQLEEEATKKAAAELQVQMDLLKKDLDEKSQLLRDTKKKELEILQKEAKMVEREENLRHELEKH